MNLIRSDTAKIKSVDETESILSFVMISNSNACMRWDWDLGEYIEELDVSGAKYSELRTLFKDHVPNVDNAIAKIENIRIENGELVCDCIFAKDEKSQNIFKKYKDGILNDVSIGYKILRQTIDNDSNPKKVLVNEFEIFELSAVWKGADKNAKKRFFDEQSQKEAKALAQARERELELMIKTL
ncbi:peptidase [Campylobacter lari]|uniref:HK97 family phage prohead protease n=1 Tax=Campylobacter lari TaxID=201 RepID=UPI0012798CA0|nr:HK97 family phage prohead protease [Campylobacter lari]EAK9948573.1 peptidase [Campylobacter lari]EDP6895738.1 peptidase [Campylobacter lari]EGK8094951.1 peptidase [Campylobacter lari]MCW0186659.1 HK97 family phage prohead protease [Campylobacter lari]MCW0230448.1 HK97 family phage prohead protease [Campylobacter lari]